MLRVRDEIKENTQSIKILMKLYIDFNTQKRKEAANEADKNHFKLLNNAAYGKAVENMRKGIK